MLTNSRIHGTESIMGFLSDAKAKAQALINFQAPADEVDELVSQELYAKAKVTPVVQGAIGFLKQDTLNYQETDKEAVRLVEEAESKAATLALVTAIMRRKERIETATAEAEAAQKAAKAYSEAVDAAIEDILSCYSYVKPGVDIDAEIKEFEEKHNVGAVPTYKANSSTAKVDKKAATKAKAPAKVTKTTTQSVSNMPDPNVNAIVDSNTVTDVDTKPAI